MTKKVIVYTIEPCPYCNNAKALLTRKNIPFEEKKLSRADHTSIMELYEKTGMRTFPQIFFGEKLIGGFDDMVALERSEGLEKYL